jgi:DNA (cytosine-5)-methyltransferase 1
MNELALFAGAGGGILGGHLLGWRTVCAVEWEPYPASVLVARQNDRLLPPFPIWNDVQTFDGKPWEGIVDVVSGGFPCQDISAAGKGAGIEGERSGMWKQMARIISEVRPKYAFVENSPMLTSRGLGTVLADLASLGLDAEWGVLSAADVGANHKRERIWILAYSSNGRHSNKVSRINEKTIGVQKKNRKERSGSRVFGGASDLERNRSTNRVHESRKLADSSSQDVERQRKSFRIQEARNTIGSPSWWETEPNVDRVVNGLAARVDRLKAIGNGQVPLCAATAWELLKKRLDETGNI